jgi:single-strand DNA-binding protein
MVLIKGDEKSKMIDTNIMILVGRLTKDAELTYANSGTALCKFSLAVNGYKKDVSFFDVTLFGKTAENLHKYLLKGTQILVSGSIKQDRWEKDGQKQSKVSIIGNTIQLLGSKLNEEAPKKSSQSSSEDENGPENFSDDTQSFYDNFPF